MSWLRDLNRADCTVVALAFLGVGNAWARRGASSGFAAGWPAAFVAGFALVVTAAALCFLATGRGAGRPHALVCAGAIGMQLMVPPSVMSPRTMVVVGVLLASVPLIRHARLAWVPVIVGAAVVLRDTVHAWAWGYAGIDVFAEVQGSTYALLHGLNPYGPVYSVYLDSPLHHIRRGAASFNYGPVVVLASLPGRLLGDVRVVLAACAVSVLIGVLLWLRRGMPGSHLGPTIAALWVGSPFIPLMILYAWTDFICLAGVAWWWVLRDRHRAWAVLCLALALASKPVFLPLIVPMVFWVRSTWRELLWAVAGAVLIMVPFALWTGTAQFVYDTITIFGDLPTRHDSIGVNGLSTVLGGGLLPASLLTLATGLAVVAFTLRRPRDYGDLLLSGAGMLIVVCLFAKQAFINYDYNAAMALLFVVAGGALAPATPMRSPLGAAAAVLRRR